MLKKEKKPIGEVKKTTTIIDPDDIFSNALSLTPQLIAELAEQGLVGRYIDYKRVKAMDGVHPKGWRVYKRKNSDIIDNHEFQFGTGPDGLVRRGSCVLAVKSEEAVAKHRLHLQQKAERRKVSYNKQAAEELRRVAKNARIDANIIEGYDENE